MGAVVGQAESMPVEEASQSSQDFRPLLKRENHPPGGGGMEEIGVGVWRVAGAPTQRQVPRPPPKTVDQKLTLSAARCDRGRTVF